MKGLASLEEQEVLSPLKKPETSFQTGGSKKPLTFDEPAAESEKVDKELLSLADEGFAKSDPHGAGYSAMQGVVGDVVPSPEKNKKGGGSGRGFKRVKRTKGSSEKCAEGVSVEKKRMREDEESMDVDGSERATKISRQVEEVGFDTLKNAGPVDRSCKDQ